MMSRIALLALVVAAASAICLAPRVASAADSPASTEPPAIASLITLSLSQDFGLHSGDDVCSKQGQLEGGYDCFRGSGTQYHGSPLRGAGGQVRPLPQPATTRLLLGFDRIIGESFALGARLGVVLRGGGPRASGADAPEFLPVHAEVRGTYTFGARPFREAGLRWSIYLSGGVAEVDTEYKLPVLEDLDKPPPVSQLDNPTWQTLRAYKKAGTGFVGGGGAMTYAVSPSLGFSVGLTLRQMFPSSGTIIAPDIACVVGF
jgi:hypothetical protein